MNELPQFLPKHTRLPDVELGAALNLLDYYGRAAVAEMVGVRLDDLNAALRGIGWQP